MGVPRLPTFSPKAWLGQLGRRGCRARSTRLLLAEILISGVPTLAVVAMAVARRRRAFDPFTSAAAREMKEQSTAKPSLRRYLAEIGTNHLEGKKYL